MAYQFKTEEERIAYENRRDTAMTNAEAYEEEYDWESFFTKIFNDDSKANKEKESDMKELEEKGFVEKDGYFLVRNDILNGFVSVYNENKTRKEYSDSRPNYQYMTLPDGTSTTYENSRRGKMKYWSDCEQTRVYLNHHPESAPWNWGK